MNRYMLAIAVALALVLPSGAAMAQTICKFSSTGAIGFGTYDSMAPMARTSQTNILVRCERNTGPANVSVMVGLGPGSNGASTAARKLVAPGSPTPLLYGLYQDSGRSINWGNVPGIDAASQTATIKNKSFETLTFTVYGSIPAQQDVYAGSYSDSIEVTLTP